MKVSELKREQLTELKQRHYQRMNGTMSGYQIWDIDELVSDEEIFEAEADTEFSDDDFCCE